MTAEEELEFYRELVRRIVVHADSFGDVHYIIGQEFSDHPELKASLPWIN